MSLAQDLCDKGAGHRHVESTVAYLHEVIDGLRWETARSISAEALQHYLAERRRRNGTGARTTNARIIAWRGFCRWMVRHGRLPTDPLAPLSRLRQDDDRRLVRRILTDVEFERLLATTRAGPTRFGLTGPDRATLVRAARRDGPETQRGREPPGVRHPPRRGWRPRGRRAGRVREEPARSGPAVPASLVAPLRAWLAIEGVPGARLWPLPDKARRRVLIPDLLAAGIAPNDERGLIDFHSFRYAFVTRLVRSAVPIKAAMTLARHSDPKLTLSTYARLSLADERAALEQAFGGRPAAANPATGTHG